MDSEYTAYYGHSSGEDIRESIESFVLILTYVERKEFY